MILFQKEETRVIAEFPRNLMDAVFGEPATKEERIYLRPAQIADTLYQLLDSLGGLEKQILTDRFVYGYSDWRICRKYRCRVKDCRRVTAKALRKLRHPANSIRLKEFVQYKAEDATGNFQ